MPKIPDVRIAVIGSGARNRTVLAGLIKASPQIAISCVFDPAHESIESARRSLGEDFAVVSNCEEALARPEVDWVMIGSPNHLHAGQILAASAAGKHVFCEKPLATNLVDCLRIRDSLTASDRLFFFGLVLRYASLYQRVRALLEGGEIGEIISFEFNETLSFNHGGYIAGNWRRFEKFSGGHLLEKCCHDLDLAQWFIGALPTRVASFGGLRFFTPEHAGRIDELGHDEQGRAAYGTWADAWHKNPFTSEKDIVDHQVAILEYANGVRGTFHTNLNAGIPERRFYFLGSEGALRADLCTGELETQRIGFGTKKSIESFGKLGGHGDADQWMIRALARTMLEGTAPLAGIEEALRASITCFAIDRSMRTGSVASLDPDWQRAGIDVINRR